MSTPSVHLVLAFSCSLTIGFPSHLPAGTSPYFPATGTGARHQIVRDLRGGAVVLSIAVEPGGEDLPTLAALRMESGARIISAYVSDGGATPSDINSDLPRWVAALRKLEADRAIRRIGGEAYFLNFPDYGIVSSIPRLEELWKRDSLVHRMAAVIRSFRPDLILLARDVRSSGGDTVRSELVRAVLKEAVEEARGGTVPGVNGPDRWSVPRVLGEGPVRGGGVSMDVDMVHPLWKKTYRRIGSESAREYGSLRFQLGVWEKDRARAYRRLGGDAAHVRGLLDGLPVISAPLNDVARGVLQAAADAEKGNDGTALLSVSQAIARIGNTVAARSTELRSPERRILSAWEGKLEELRCAILNVDVRFVLSDTLLARRQLFTLLFPVSRDFPSKGNSEIIFPGAMDSTWLINRTEGFRFRFALPDTLEMITPELLPLNRPLSSNGSGESSPFTVVPFIVAHKDPDPLRNFACRREILFGTAPPQTSEIFTPVVRVVSGERLVIRLQNISRNPYKGNMWAADSIVNEKRVAVSLPRKDYALTDTLPLVWKDSVGEGDHLISVRIGKGAPVGVITARKFRADADTSVTVGLITALVPSPVGEALRRLQVRFIAVDSSSLTGSSSYSLHTIIIDRDALAMRRDGTALRTTIAEWVRAGGHCVLLRQRPSVMEGPPLFEDIDFASGGAIPPEKPVAFDRTSLLLQHPNQISAGDWQEWIISRAQSPLRLRAAANPVIHVRDESSGEPLVASMPLGKGAVTAVALDLLPQLQIVHPGAYRLLANLVSY